MKPNTSAVEKLSGSVGSFKLIKEIIIVFENTLGRRGSDKHVRLLVGFFLE
jgi:hypothetical protein